MAGKADHICSLRDLPVVTLAVPKPFSEAAADANALAYIETRPIWHYQCSNPLGTTPLLRSDMIFGRHTPSNIASDVALLFPDGPHVHELEQISVRLSCTYTSWPRIARRRRA